MVTYFLENPDNPSASTRCSLSKLQLAPPANTFGFPEVEKAHLRIPTMMRLLPVVLAFVYAAFAVVEYHSRYTYPTPLSGAAVLITGGKRGIGLAAAKRLVKEGFHVFVGI